MIDCKRNWGYLVRVGLNERAAQAFGNLLLMLEGLLGGLAVGVEVA